MVLTYRAHLLGRFACLNNGHCQPNEARPTPILLPLKKPYSHSIVAGGFDDTSYTTRLIPRTSLMMREDTLASKGYGS